MVTFETKILARSQTKTCSLRMTEKLHVNEEQPAINAKGTASGRANSKVPHLRPRGMHAQDLCPFDLGAPLPSRALILGVSVLVLGPGEVADFVFILARPLYLQEQEVLLSPFSSSVDIQLRPGTMLKQP